MSTDHNGNPITIDGDMMVVRVAIHSEGKAVVYPNGRTTLLSDSAFAGWPRGNATFGTDLVDGEALVTVNLRELRSLAFAAARNKSKKAQQGPARATFLGTRKFTPEGK